MKQRLLTMLVLMLIAVGTLYALNVTSNAPNRVANGFERKFLPIESTIAHKLEFATPVRELAGTWGDSLFLMTIEPGKVYVTDRNLKKPNIVLLEDPKIERIVPRFYTTVRYPYVYILGGNAVAYAVGNLKTGKTEKIDLHLNTIFDNPVLLDSHFIARVMDPKTLNSRFIMIDYNGNIVKYEKDISLGKQDGGMVYSSLLKYDDKNRQLINLHYYDNGYEVFTSDLKLMRRGNTIDTTNHNPTKIVVKDGAVAYQHPPIAVNGYSAVHNGYLYVRSKLLADNENKAKFYSHTVIDQYDLNNNGNYVGSFYLPNMGDEQVGQFYFIDDNKILAFSDKQVVIYHLQSKTFAKPHT